jgi:hypothetical protein
MRQRRRWSDTTADSNVAQPSTLVFGDRFRGQLRRASVVSRPHTKSPWSEHIREEAAVALGPTR